VLQLPALFQDLQRNRGRRHRECQPRNNRATPGKQPEPMSDECNCKRRRRQLSSAETEDGPAHCQQLPELELEPDEEEQHHHPELRYRKDALGRGKEREPGRTDNDAP